MASLKQQLYDTFQALVKERDQLRLEVSQAQEIISLLETEINAIKCHGDAAFDKVAETRKIARHTFELVSEPSPTCSWLKDLWLSDSSNTAILGPAEAAWKENLLNPQKALNLVGKVLTGNIKQCERIRCNLFVAAIMLATGNTEETCAGANEMLRLCGNDFRYRHLAGIAYYLRGRVFLEINSLHQAYWDFSLAVFTPGYHERVKQLQRHTEILIMQEEDPKKFSTSINDGSKGQLPLETASNSRPLLKLSPEAQVSLDEFKFEKPPTTPMALHGGVQPDRPNLSGPAPHNKIDI